MKTPNWVEADAQQTPMWLGCVEAAKQCIDIATYCGAKFEYDHITEVRGMAAIIYKKVSNLDRFYP